MTARMYSVVIIQWQPLHVFTKGNHVPCSYYIAWCVRIAEYTMFISVGFMFTLCHVSVIITVVLLVYWRSSVDMYVILGMSMVWYIVILYIWQYIYRNMLDKKICLYYAWKRCYFFYESVLFSEWSDNWKKMSSYVICLYYASKRCYIFYESVKWS